MPAINPLPIAPSTLRPDTFASEMDTFLAALPGFASELDAVGAAASLGTTSTSTSTLTFGTGARTLTVDLGKGYVPGMDVVIASTASPTSRMIATVTSYNSSTGVLVVNATANTGSGSAASWSVSLTIAGKDYVERNAALGTPTSGDVGSCTVGGVEIGFRNVPQNSRSAAYTLVLGDAGDHILHPSADTTARTFTIPANSSVPFPIGTAITFVNQAGAGVVTIAITTDVMRLAGAGTTGSRTLAANGIATALKITAAEWIISGVNLT